MKLAITPTNQGIALTVSDGTSQEEPRYTVSDPKKPRGWYVYGHYDTNRSLFYIGKGIGKRAWSKDRHPLWTRYVENHLSGNYEVKIIADCLTESQAEEIEADLIAKHSGQLVNWINMGRLTDYHSLSRYHALRDANRKLIDDTCSVEDTEPLLAVQRYKSSIAKIAEYAFLQCEKGLVGQLLKEESDEEGYSGELKALDRLTICLIKLGSASEASEELDSYFRMYKRDLKLKAAEVIKRRVEKALGRNR